MKPVISRNNAKKAQSRLQIKYEKLLNNIEEQQQYNNNLQSSLQTAQAKLSVELEPLTKRYYNLLLKLLFAIDSAANKAEVGKHNKDLLEAYMTETSKFLLRTFGYQDKQLAALLLKYGNITAENMVKNYEDQLMSAKFSQLYGFAIDVREMLEKGEENYFAENRHHFYKARQTKLNEIVEGEPAQDLNTKTAIKRGEHEKLLTGDARSVYMRLIKKFHPDLERDEARQNANTEIVKEITKAYQEKDFFSLLKLQIRYLDDSETEATKIADNMLKRYNKILQKQLTELKQWIYTKHYTSGNMIEDFIDQNGNFSPQKFATRRNFLKKRNDAIKMEIEASVNSPKTWFKEYLNFIRSNQDK